MTATERPKRRRHDWYAAKERGLPVMKCKRGGCFMVWRPDRKEPSTPCIGVDVGR